MKLYNFTFSINVHENIEFLLKQLSNIEKYVIESYCVILNCNLFMYKELIKNKKINSMKNIYINNEYFDKKTFHGSLFKGIYSNLTYAIQHFKFNYFIILSSRNLFYNKFDNRFIKSENECIKYNKLNKNNWHWNNNIYGDKLLNTKLAKHIIEKDLCFSRSEHEGLVFNYKSCLSIIKFLEKQTNIKNDLFNWNHCVEEFALQSILCNNNNKYYNIGNGTKTHVNVKNLPNNKYVHKVYRNNDEYGNNTEFPLNVGFLILLSLFVIKSVRF